MHLKGCVQLLGCTSGRQGLDFFPITSNQPRAVLWDNKKKQGNKVDKQNKGKAKRAVKNCGGGDNAVDVGDLFVHNKKNPGTSAAPESFTLDLAHRPHDGTALSGRSRRMSSVIMLISCFFIFFRTFSCVYIPK